MRKRHKKPPGSQWIAALIRITSSHPQIEHVLDTVARLSEKPVRTNFLLLGEPGTGKEGLARALHELVGGGSPLLKVREPQMLAPALKKASRGGMVLIDELLALGPTEQLELLDALKQPGGPRVIAMTDEDPIIAVNGGRLRHDLYWRLARIVLTLPPLRERTEDIPAAAVWMGNRILRDHGSSAEMRLPEDTVESKSDVVLTGGAIEALRAHDWKGNFRELEAVMERALLLYRETGPLTAESVRLALIGPPPAARKRLTSL
jgi:two-component system, NtrC family, nitrogen regulation response regulator GlnG